MTGNIGIVKKLGLCVVIAFIAVCMFASLPMVHADASDFTYRVLDGANCAITGYTGVETDIIIPSQIDSYTVRSIDENAFYDRSELKSVVLPSTLESIGTRAFYRCVSLTNVEFPSALTRIGIYAFYECTSLTSINLQDTALTTIDDNAFRGCGNVEAVVLPDSVTTMGYLIFMDCTKLASINYPRSLATVGNWNSSGSGNFNGCASLKMVVVPEGVTAIAPHTFGGFDISIETIVLPSTLLSIGNYAFYGNQTAALNLPNSVQTIGESAFQNCPGLKNVDLTNTSLVTLGTDAFGNCANLESMKLPDSVTTYGRGVFNNCPKLASINYPLGLASSGTNVYAGCTSLETITVPEGVTTIPENAFYSSDSLKSVVLPSTLESIGTRAFYRCVSLTELGIPRDLTSIGSYAFYECSSLESIMLLDKVTSIGVQAFFGWSEQFTIRTIPGSYAYQYAIDNEIPVDLSGAYQIVSIIVEDKNKEPVLNGYAITWYMKDSETPIATGNTIFLDIFMGNEYEFFVALEEELGVIYKDSGRQPLILAEGQTSVTFTLEEIPSVTVTGMVIDSNGEAIEGAKLLFAQQPNGRFIVEKSVYSGANGEFIATVLSETMLPCLLKKPGF